MEAAVMVASILFSHRHPHAALLPMQENYCDDIMM
jgi:hypothetical protein